MSNSISKISTQLLNSAKKLAESKGFVLRYNNDVLELFKPEENSSISVDFTSAKALKRINEPGIFKQDIIKAIGLNKKRDITILDATAGLGRDSFIFASICTNKVLMLERNPISSALLDDGLIRLKKEINNQQLKEISSKLLKDSLDAINFLNNNNKFDVIYLDPMFSGEGQKKSAKVKKEMAFFQQTIGSDNDADLLLKPALENAKMRVVVKRHKNAPYLNNHKPDIEFKGKSNRFDVYLIKK